MSSAQIVITQAGVKGVAGQSRPDMVTGQLVTLSNANDADVRSWRWSLELPSGSSAVLSNPVSPQPTFTPDVEGTYRITLTVDEGNTGQMQVRLAAVRNPPVMVDGTSYTTRFPARAEGDEANWLSIEDPGAINDAGWWEALDVWLHMLQGVATSGSGGGSRLTFTPNPIFGGIPGAQTYLYSGDEGIPLLDTGPSVPPDTLVLSIPDITSLSAGQEIALVLPLGNPVTTITFAPAVSDWIINPATGGPVGPPGTPLVIPFGTYGINTYLHWKLSPDGAWLFVGDRIGAGGGGEANTASNVGAGEGPFKGKVGIDLEFKTYISSDSSLSITADTDTLDFEVDASFVQVSGSSTDNAIARFDGTGGTIQDSNATIGDDGSLTMGDGTGTVALRLDKDDTGLGQIQWANEGVTQWQWYQSSDEELYLARSGGTTLLKLSQASGLAEFSNYVALTSASPFLTVGDGTGEPRIKLNKSEVGISGIQFQKLGSQSWLVSNVANENLLFAKVGAANVLELSQATGEVKVYNDFLTLGDAALGSASPTLTVGDGTGSPDFIIDKSETGSARLVFQKLGAQSWEWESDAAEDLVLRDDGGGVFCTFSNAVPLKSYWGGDMALSSPNAVHTVGTGTGAPVISLNALGTSAGKLEWSSAGAMKWAFQKDSNDHFRIQNGAFADIITLHQTLLSVSVKNDLLVNKRIEFTDMAAPANPGAARGSLYKLTGDDGIWWKPDASGAAVDLTAATAVPWIKGVPTDGVVLLVDAVDINSYPGSGTAVKDLTGTSDPATISGNTVYAEGAFDFDGVSGKITFPVGAEMDDVFAAGAWVFSWQNARSDGEGSESRILSKENGAATTGWGTMVRGEIAAQGTCDLEFRVGLSGGVRSWYVNDTACIDTPVFVAWYWDSDNPLTEPIAVVNGIQRDVTLRDSGTGTYNTDAGVTDLVVGNIAADSRTFDGWIGMFGVMASDASVDVPKRIYHATRGRFEFATSAIVDRIELTSAVTSVVMGGFSSERDGLYKLTGRVVRATATNPNAITWEPDGITANQRSRYEMFEDGIQSEGTSTLLDVVTFADGDGRAPTLALVDMTVYPGHTRGAVAAERLHQSFATLYDQSLGKGADCLATQMVSGVWDDTSTDWNECTVKSSVTSGLDAGTQLTFTRHAQDVE